MCSLKKLCIVSFSELSKSTLIPKPHFSVYENLTHSNNLLLVSARVQLDISFTLMSSVKRLCEEQYDNVWDVR